MRKRHDRYLPVMEDDMAVGVVSIQYLCAVTTEQLVQGVHE